MSQFQDELTGLLNRHSKENDSNTPDFILAKYLEQCLAAFTAASNAREKWFGRKLDINQQYEIICQTPISYT